MWDVGGVFDAAADRFDHHQRGAPARPNGTPFSSAGLVWQVYGERAVAALLRPEEAFAAAIAAELDAAVVQRIDEIDNGVSPTGPLVHDPLGLAALIGDCNPSWDAPAEPGAGDAAFLEATALAEAVLRRRVDSLRARMAADAIVLAAHGAGDDPHILVLDRGMPWKNAVFSHGLPVLFAVSPASNGNWMVDTMPARARLVQPALAAAGGMGRAGGHGLGGADGRCGCGVRALTPLRRRSPGPAQGRSPWPAGRSGET